MLRSNKSHFCIYGNIDVLFVLGLGFFHSFSSVHLADLAGYSIYMCCCRGLVISGRQISLFLSIVRFHILLFLVT